MTQIDIMKKPKTLTIDMWLNLLDEKLVSNKLDKTNQADVDKIVSFLQTKYN